MHICVCVHEHVHARATLRACAHVRGWVWCQCGVRVCVCARVRVRVCACVHACTMHICMCTFQRHRETIAATLEEANFAPEGEVLTLLLSACYLVLIATAYHAVLGTRCLLVA